MSHSILDFGLLYEKPLTRLWILDFGLLFLEAARRRLAATYGRRVSDLVQVDRECLPVRVGRLWKMELTPMRGI
ncbi:hypothetical protein ACE1AT_29580 [Pelatocladus sp. BLCC-F211]|uniref:hypothetical protein n=1 Tax=Pelatocladus sp. BLCC-F211 TaxID=3342752 RepID=UPI0035B804DC